MRNTTVFNCSLSLIMLTYLGKKIFGTKNDRVIRAMRPFVVKVNDLERVYQDMSDEELTSQTVKFRERLDRGEPLDNLQVEAFAVVREAAKRTLGMRHFDVQIVGGAVLHSGGIAEMKTGEGKTLVSTLPAYLNALSGKGVHIVTVNDYLAKRDAEWMGRVHKFLGLRVGCIWPHMPENEKKPAYEADITYGQNNEFGFDYLRDNMKFSAAQMAQRGHNYAIIDEVDSILIDEARTPLIISGPAEESSEVYYTVDKVIPKFQQEKHYEIDLKTKNPTLTDEGVELAQNLLSVDNLYDPKHIETLHHVNQALRAHVTMERDSDYVVRNGEVIIVDDFTGRLMPGRRWSDGLHQAVEAKEGLRIARESRTLASITFQNYFRMYDKLSGMTGTADTEAGEFREIYNLDVAVIPTNKPMVRDDQSDVVFRTRSEKYNAVVEDIAEINKTGQPILVGTITIEQSETVSKHLTQKGVPHNVLNAKFHEQEAEIVAQAGRLGAVTIATNMAGRGTDIMLGGDPERLAAEETGSRDPENAGFQAALIKAQELCEQEKKEVIDLGGLFICGTERHESRRIDNQLRGRAGRQGDPGVSRFYISLEDDLMARFGGERMQVLMKRLGWEEGVAIDGKIISKSIENAQRKVEGMHFESRKWITDYDNVLNKQRQVIYNLRGAVLQSPSIRDQIAEMIDDLTETLVMDVCNENTRPLDWDLDELEKKFSFLFKAPCALERDVELSQQNIFDELRKQAKSLYEKQEELVNAKLIDLKELPFEMHISPSEDKPNTFTTLEQDTFLEALDHFWNQHLQDMSELREG